MTSTITNYSALIDTTYPVPGVDNDTQGFRDNYIQIKRGLESAASEITDLQISQYEVNTRLNNATVVGDNYATLIASTVTTLVINSLTNNIPDIVTPIVKSWYDNTITNDIVTLENTLTTNTLVLQNQITTVSQAINSLQAADIVLNSTATTLWNNVDQLFTEQSSLTNRVEVIEGQFPIVEATATQAWQEATSLQSSTLANTNAIISIQSTVTNLWNTTYGPGNALSSIASINNDISGIKATAVNTGLAIASLQSTIAGMPQYASQYPPVASAKGTPGDKRGMYYADLNYIYVCISDYTNGSVNIWVRAATTSSW